MKEIVTYDNAKLARELGFKGDRLYIATNKKPKAHYYTTSGVLNGDVLIRDKDERGKVGGWFSPTISAPTQVELCDWIRTEYKLHVYSIIHFTGVWGAYIQRTDESLLKGQITHVYGLDKEYEFAIEVGITSALKKIKEKI